MKSLIATLSLLLFVGLLHAQTTPTTATPADTPTGQTNPPAVPAPWPIGPPVDGQLTPASITITSIDFYDAATDTYAGATFAKGVWTAPNGSANKPIRIRGTATAATGGGVLPNTQVMTSGLLTNAGNINPFCDIWYANGDFEINYVEANAGDLTAKNNLITGYVNINQDWTVNQKPKTYSTASMTFFIKY